MGIVTEQIYPTSRLLSNITGILVPPNKAIVGANAFAHEAGIHQDGVLKEKTTYEIMRPETVGISQSTLVLGKHSGRHAFRDRIRTLGYELSEVHLNQAFQRFKEVADKKKQVYDEDIEAIIADEILRIPDSYKLINLNVVSGSVTVPTATVQIEMGGKLYQEAGSATGPVDAAYKTISKITKTKSHLVKFSVNAITGGTDAQGEVLVILEEGGHPGHRPRRPHRHHHRRGQGLYQRTQQTGIPEAHQRSLRMIRPMTITEKILAEHAGLREVEPGQLINAKVDLVLGNDITAPIAIEEFRRVGATKVFDPAKIVLDPGSLCPQQGHQVGPAMPVDARLRQGTESPPLLTKWAKWASSTPSSRNRGSCSPETWSSAPTATPAPTGPWGPFPPASARRTSPRP